MSDTIKHAPGTFCWPELSTSDQAGAKKFYSALFGWTASDQTIGPGMVYTIFKLDDKDVAAGHQMEPAQASQGIPPNWLSYVSVDNADEAVAKAKTLGGTAMAGPFDVMDAGRMGLLVDPAGAVFAVWQGNNVPGIQRLNEPRTLAWTELLSTNADAVREFYTKLFGWGTQIHEMGPMKYTVFLRGDKPAGGLMQTTPDMGNLPSHWLSYFGADDVDKSTAKATELGASAIMPPADVPGVGRFSVIKDPQGAVFGLLKFNLPAK